MSKPGFQELHPEVKQAIEGIELIGDKVTISDSGNYNTSENTEGALQEIGQTLNGTRQSIVSTAQALGVM